MPDDSELDPQAAALLDGITELPIPPSYALSVESARERMEAFFVTDAPEPVATVESFSIPGADGPVDARLYRPRQETPPLVVYFHGGGWVLGGLDSHDTLCRALVTESDLAVLSIDYRLAPEHPFPAAFEDAYAAVEWAAAHADSVGCDPGRLGVAGDSAGGNLAAAVSLALCDRGGPDVDAQGLIYPAVAAPGIHDFESYVENARGYFLELPSMEWFYGHYLSRGVDRRNAYAAPLLAENHSELPPATVITAGFDPLRDEGERYAAKLAKSGVDVRHEAFPGMIHGFLSMTEKLDRARDGIAAVADGLNSSL